MIDPYAGSASTLVAARMCGRRCIGAERKAEYAALAATRLSQGVLALTGESSC